MVRNAVRFVSFMALFAAAFLALQPAFILKTNDGVAFAQLYNEPEGSLDVIILGASGIRSSVLPPVLWREAGIRSYSLAMSAMNAAGSYYMATEALRIQSPRLVIVSGKYLFTRIDFGEAEPRLRTALDHMRLTPGKLAAICDVASNDGGQRVVDYVFPLLRYHDRDDLTAADFDLTYMKARNALMGSWLESETTSKPQERPAGFAAGPTGEPAATRGEYLTRIIGLCEGRGVDVLIVYAPTCAVGEWSPAMHEALRIYSEERGVGFLDFNVASVYGEVGLDAGTDFFDPNHTNVAGGEKVSVYLARYLSDRYGLADMREGPYDPHWDVVVETFEGRLGELRGHVGSLGGEGGAP
ncbi:MAG: hypothetical protein FWE70_04955 [Oscillospiraceae bacterium]|nr:hypothetical protein [Oscillospiraceae bacterium]